MQSLAAWQFDRGISVEAPEKQSRQMANAK